MLNKKIIKSAKEWNDIIERFSGVHVLQTWEWGQIKSQFGWNPLYVAWYKSNSCIAASLILKKTKQIIKNGPGVSIFYAPRGPLLDWTDLELATQMINELEKILNQEKGLFLKIDPELPIGYGIPNTADELEIKNGQKMRGLLQAKGWQFSKDQIQFRNTVWIDLTLPENSLLSGMKQKTRYNIRLAERRGVIIRKIGPNDLKNMYKMYTETSLRDGFIIRPWEYYHNVWNLFLNRKKADGLIAEVNGKAVAGLFIFYFAQKAWYLYGMSTEKHRDLMPNYLLQWQAIKLAKEKGCKTYDMWGAPDYFNQDDPLWGVFRFKQGFNGSVVRTIGAWDYIRTPFLYNLYNLAMKIFHSVSRILRRKKIQNELQM